MSDCVALEKGAGGAERSCFLVVAAGFFGVAAFFGGSGVEAGLGYRVDAKIKGYSLLSLIGRRTLRILLWIDSSRAFFFCNVLRNYNF